MACRFHDLDQAAAQVENVSAPQLPQGDGVLAQIAPDLRPVIFVCISGAELRRTAGVVVVPVGQRHCDRQGGQTAHQSPQVACAAAGVQQQSLPAAHDQIHPDGALLDGEYAAADLICCVGRHIRSPYVSPSCSWMPYFSIFRYREEG